MKRIVYLVVLTLCLTFAFLDHDKKDLLIILYSIAMMTKTDGASQSISMPCGLSEKHKIKYVVLLKKKV